MPLGLAVLLSGGGTTLENLCEAIDRGELDAEVRLVVSSRADAFGLERARRRGIPSAVVASRDFRRPVPDSASLPAPARDTAVGGSGVPDAPGAAGVPDWRAFSDALAPVVDDAGAELVCFAGFMCRWHVPARYAGRVMNIHPALLPAFGGRGMYGRRVHEAVAAAGVKVSGCTVHFVDDEYDAGPIVVQRTCPVFDTDTPDDIARRVFREECVAYPEAIRLFASGRLRLDGRVVRVAP